MWSMIQIEGEHYSFYDNDGNCSADMHIWRSGLLSLHGICSATIFSSTLLCRDKGLFNIDCSHKWPSLIQGLLDDALAAGGSPQDMVNSVLSGKDFCLR